ncbi:Protein CBG26301 [Caenorhabditis briggsae]|uniref:Protein CBG26301 n=1 Tax=Caenorhabditis briggsae TaxID=6238 RepID=B6IG74_CAEBR|nr:Protein CBG26301 [Caenorhabditis briggsae]CAR98904.1 Protein CBG26301 [Caenorhabditis briggsae]
MPFFTSLNCFELIEYLGFLSMHFLFNNKKITSKTRE